MTVRNNLQQTIPIRIQDQIPISTDSRIEVELGKKDRADYDAGTGILTWKLDVSPNSSDKIEFSYQLKYPKGRSD